MEPDILYHYTSLDALYAIISNIKSVSGEDAYFTLRATHASFLNDLNEGRLLPEALKELGLSEDILWNAQLIQGYPFVLSLSELRNDLNMWRCYADDGKGVSIGLKKSVLENPYPYPKIGELVKCQYITKEKLKQHLKTKGVEELIRTNDFTPLARLIQKGLLTYKDSAFEAEREWRINVLGVESNYRINNEAGLIIPYSEIKLPVTAIKSITIGPKSDYERNKFAVLRFLKTKITSVDLSSIRISSSLIPLT